MNSTKLKTRDLKAFLKVLELLMQNEKRMHCTVEVKAYRDKDEVKTVFRLKEGKGMLTGDSLLEEEWNRSDFVRSINRRIKLECQSNNVV